MNEWEAFTRPRWPERHALIVAVLVGVCLILLALVPMSRLEAGGSVRGAHSGQGVAP